MAVEILEENREVEEMVATTMQVVEASNNNNNGNIVGGGVEAHPYAFHVSGPRNLSSPTWRDIISSSWFVFISLSLLLFFPH